MQTIATALLAVMAVVFVLSAHYTPALPALAWLEAFSEAALIGGLADWFAVVALFRRPFGIPLPHTAIVPANKDRIAAQLSAFVEENFLTPANLKDAIARVLTAVDAGGPQQTFERALPVVAAWLDGQRTEIKRRFAKKSMLTPGWFDGYVVDRFIDGMRDLLDEIAADPEHPLRETFDTAVARFVENVPARLRREVSALIEEVVRRWDAAEVSAKIELEIGPDLQYVRLNGSIVGGCAGLALHAVLLAVGAA